VAAWTARNGCDEAPTITELPDLEDDGTTVRRERYSGCDGGAEVVYYAILGGGHTWPGSGVPSGGFVGRTSRDISASETAARFFLDHIR
jgi:polyhydroxybutyrate depolymerase